MERYVLAFSSSLERIRNYVPITKLHLQKVLLVWVIGVGYWCGRGGAKSSRMSFFRGVKVRVDEKWTWGEGGQKRPKMGGRPLYTVPYLVCSELCLTLCYI